MADAWKFVRPDLAPTKPPPAHRRDERESHLRRQRLRRQDLGARYRPQDDGARRPPPAREEVERASRDLPPKFDFGGEDLLKLMDGINQSVVLAGLPVQYDPPAKLREVMGKILDQMGFPEDLLPEAAFDPGSRWKILGGCILCYGALGVWQAVSQRKLALALIQQQMAERRAASAKQSEEAARKAEDASVQKAKSTPPPGPGESREEHVAEVGHRTDGGRAPNEP